MGDSSIDFVLFPDNEFDHQSNQSKGFLEMMKSDVCKIHRTCLLIMDNVKRAINTQFNFFSHYFFGILSE